MAINKEVILFNNCGLDSDVAKRFKVPGNSNYILNDIISFIEGETGARVNAKGNELVYSSSLTASFIGKVNDIENSSIIIFVHNTSGKHSIIRFNIKDNSVDLILFEQTVLNFSLDHPIIHANVIGELLMWTDGYNPPRKININKAIEFTKKTVYVFTDGNGDIFTDNNGNVFI